MGQYIGSIASKKHIGCIHDWNSLVLHPKEGLAEVGAIEFSMRDTPRTLETIKGSAFYYSVSLNIEYLQRASFQPVPRTKRVRMQSRWL